MGFSTSLLTVGEMRVRPRRAVRTATEFPRRSIGHTNPVIPAPSDRLVLGLFLPPPASSATLGLRGARMVQRVSTVAFEGIEARAVDVQVGVAPGLPAFIIVGLPDKAVSEAHERVRGALVASGLALPAWGILQGGLNFFGNKSKLLLDIVPFA